MDVAQPYLPNSCSWTSWCTSDNSISTRRKRIRLDNTDHNNSSVKYATETEQAWSGVDELTGELPAVQLNNLGVEMQQDYNIGDEFLVFDSFNNFKQEIPSPPNTAENHILRQYSPIDNVHNNKKYGNSDQNERDFSPRKLPSSASSSPPSCYSTSCNNASDVKQHNDCQVYNKENNSNNYCREHINTSNTVATCPSSPDALDDSFRFQYVLCAATSIAMKINEETLTYLNQGQPYEIKLKKLGDLTQLRGKVFKSVIRVLFHDRRLQYMEKQQMSAWQASRPGDKILQLDLPLSYGIFDHFQDPNALNAVQFLWDPTKEVGVYIKVNCISTEFTAKKHGGEKGVPFRLQIETYTHEKNPRSLHMASCQIKVFKLKGADRKHKQDREKIMKKSPIERENYQNSYECTVFTDMCPSGDPLSPCVTANSSVTSSPGNTDSDGGPNNGLSTFDYDSNLNDTIGADTLPQSSNITLSRESSILDMQQWLRYNRFGSYIHLFENYTVSDMLSMSRDDFIQICGVPDGIRLFNSLPIVSKLTMYISTENNSNIYHPAYLKSLTCQELINKVAPLIGLQASQIHSAFLLGPHNSQIIITDDLVRNIKEETLFFAEIYKNPNNSSAVKKLFLKPVTPSSSIPSH
ncbi:transcription factor CP2-like protein 1 isoform X1 [Planococcus citri]|uniref:transcription factor CP2-like protein 1 isoform X1 n=1 Tax=Planococcus citri TaxID=170843 RepID=UPI0031F872DE